MDLVLTRENLDPILEATTLDRDSEPEREIVDIDPTFGSEQWLGPEYPKMAAAA
jgi:hypothetical protein